MPNLSSDELAKLPPGIASIISQQQAGAGSPDPNQQQLGQSTTGDLNGALARRFGQDQSFDPTYDAGIRGLIGQVPGIQNSYETGQQRVNEDFQTTAQRLNQQNDTANSSQQNAMANQGMGYSGANLLGKQKLGEAFQTSVFGANQARTRSLDSLTQAQTNALSAIRGRESDLQGAATSRASVADQAKAWAQQQQALETTRLQQEQAAAQQAQTAAAQQAAQQQAMLKQMEAQALAAAQPVSSPTGSVAPAPSAPASNTVQGPATGPGIPGGATASRGYDMNNPNDVLALQTSLQSLGYYSGQIDGKFGPESQKALAAYNSSGAAGVIRHGGL